ncbi:LamB/YcsF family protein [Bacillus shivajii]|uniref:LamB/YcsF family protein n=1 Tax=Bacillus shivajii TaxID=1983719 RepID=UPI001CFA9040|nr:5-oxoprolinase subunit PxpA [Bacillus shivajii]UCZ53107.1 LamB/YcsF family protein [Bacillus shivajii]
MKHVIDLNCDLGESFGHYKLGEDEQVLNDITSANIACGFHAGDYNVMHRTVKLALEKEVAIGAHPGLPDLAGFGRRYMEFSPQEVFNMVVYQMNALNGFTSLYGVPIHHIKPHGALYNIAASNYSIAEAVAKAVIKTDKQLILYGLANSELIKAGKEVGLKTAEEVFADRTYKEDGTLTPRTKENALIHDTDQAVAQVLQMVKQGTVTSTNGTEVAIQADTLCVHGDSPQALQFVKTIRELFKNEGIEAKAIGNY